MKSGTLEGGKLVEDGSADTIEARALFYGSHIFFFFRRLFSVLEFDLELSVVFFLLTQ